jgi:hypothetical protein
VGTAPGPGSVGSHRGKWALKISLHMLAYKPFDGWLEIGFQVLGVRSEAESDYRAIAVLSVYFTMGSSKKGHF